MRGLVAVACILGSVVVLAIEVDQIFRFAEQCKFTVSKLWKAGAELCAHGFRIILREAVGIRFCFRQTTFGDVAAY